MVLLRRVIFALLAFRCVVVPVAAQESPAVSENNWRAVAQSLWTIEFGYPMRAGTGLTLVTGTKERLTGYESQVRGLLVGADAAIAGVAARIGWADLRPYDAGLSGYSTELVIVRPLGVDSRLDRGVPYLGPGGSYYFFNFRVSGAILLATKAARRRVVPSIMVALVVPLGS